jgi:hypothetical protein
MCVRERCLRPAAGAIVSNKLARFLSSTLFIIKQRRSEQNKGMNLIFRVLLIAPVIRGSLFDLGLGSHGHEC